MELILHFSVHCANISFFFETTKFLGEFLLLALISPRLTQISLTYSVSGGKSHSAPMDSITNLSKLAL